MVNIVYIILGLLFYLLQFKGDVVIKDDTSINLWEYFVEKIEDGKSYENGNLSVIILKGKHFYQQ